MLTEEQSRQSDTHTRARGQRIRRGVRRDLKRDFLRKYRETWHLTFTCEQIGISRSTLYRWRKQDQAFNTKIETISLDLYHALLRAKRADKNGTA